MADRTKSLPIASLIEDMEYYPRHDVNDAHVSNLVKAIETGEILPPPVVDTKSKRIIDGWHRIRAHKRVLGPEGVIDVILRSYSSEQEMLLDAITMNATHGRALDKIDYIRCAVMCQNRGIETLRIAAAFHQPEKEVQKYFIKVVYGPSGSPDIIPTTTDTIALKRPVRHLAGTTITKEQAEAMPAVPGTSYLLLARQLRDAVTYGLANREDAVLMEALRELRDALIAYFG